MIILILGVFVLGGCIGFILGLAVGVEAGHWKDIRSGK